MLKTPLRYINNSVENEEEYSTDEDGGDEDNISIKTRKIPPPVPAGRRDTTLVFTTSISKGIFPPRFNRNYEHGFASFTRFHGAKAEYIPAYVVPRMSKDKPSIVIIQAGGNDLPDNRRDPNSMVNVANSIIEAGLTCRKLGATNVLIGGVTIRRTTFLQERCKELNGILKNLCLISNFKFINNSDIKEEHLHSDGVHLNDDGSKVLADNYLRALYEVHLSS